jgi:lipoyl(octanoyl) transferase
MDYQWLGLQDFETMFREQKQSLMWAPEREVVWGLEHPPVITLGRRARMQDELPETFDDIPVVVTDRGGLATLHSPGQLVIYPLISIARRQWGPRDYVCQLLKITKQCLQEMGIDGQVDEAQSGLFVGSNKICFVGLRVSSGRVYHGLSLNVSNDLMLFDRIRSCGLQRRPMTSLRALGVNASPEEVYRRWVLVARDSGRFNLAETWPEKDSFHCQSDK